MTNDIGDKCVECRCDTSEGICDDCYIRRVEETVDIVVENMDVKDLIQYTAHSLKDYYVNVAPSEEVDEFLEENVKEEA